MKKQSDDSESQPVAMLEVYGARTNNLRDIDIKIPHEKLVVITGRSGSGKSSLAFDTIFAEGQRQYIESLSTYSRQFFKQLTRADVDLIEGLQPTLSLDQQPKSTSRRSTVGTVTEIYDFLRVLMARAGDIACYQCGEPIRQQTPQQIQEFVLALPNATKVMVLSPLVIGRKGKHEDVFAKIRRERLVRVRIDGDMHDIDQLPDLNGKKSHSIEAITDRIIIKEGIGNRLLEAIELAARLSDGLVLAVYREPDQDEWQEQLLSTLYACPNCQINYAEIQPRTFSFNSPYGVCNDCEGFGVKFQFDPQRVVPDRSLSLEQNAVVPWANLTKAARKKHFASLGPLLEQIKFSLDQPLDLMSASTWDKFLNHSSSDTPGLLNLLARELATSMDEERLDLLDSLHDEVDCQACGGSRLNAQANAVRFAGKTLLEIVRLPLDEAQQFFDSVSLEGDASKIAEPLVEEIKKRLRFLVHVGVGYLSLGRAAESLSGGELQRVRLATSIGSGLTNVCYVLDEPSIGLHPRDNDRLIDSIRNLQIAGNSVLVVEHDEAMMRAADHLVDIGPGAGVNGGRVVAEGSPNDVAQAKDSLTGQYLRGERRIPVPKSRRGDNESQRIVISGASGFNLKNICVEIPLGRLVCVTGVSGSGKSTLINQTLAPVVMHDHDLLAIRPAAHDSIEGLQHIDKLICVDQKPIGRTARGCAATYTGVWDEIRKIYAATQIARQRGYSASRFSFNSKAGWCPECQGHGVRRLEMNFLPDMFVTCDSCDGRRFNRQTLQVRFRDLTVADVLEMPISEAMNEFENIHKIHVVLKSLNDVGLGYLSLGQRSTTLSGGEAQRIKLATELARKNTGKTLYLLDEPTTGLHFEDVSGLLNVLQQLVELGNSVIVIEHNLDVIKCADWVIDLGPEGGEQGGELIVCGTPEHVAEEPASFTGRFLQELLTH